MRDRIPFLLAALLVAALVALVGVAAFSITGSDEAPEEQAFDAAISGRVASAILAASVSTPLDQPVAVAAVPAAPGSATTSSLAPSTTAGDTTPPPLVVTSPDDGATVSSSVVEFTGTSEPGAAVSSGPFAATVDAQGNWVIKLVVTTGYNSTVFTARDSAGNESSVRIVVYYDPPAVTTTTHAHATTTTHTHTTTTTTTIPPSNCPVPGSCSPQWPADPAGQPGRERWRSLVAQYWQAERVECVLDLIRVESGGNPQASNNGNYLGLLQHSYWLWNNRARRIGMVDGNGLTAHPYNGEANIAAGAWLANNSNPWWQPWPPTNNIASCVALRSG